MAPSHAPIAEQERLAATFQRPAFYRAEGARRICKKVFNERRHERTASGNSRSKNSTTAALSTSCSISGCPRKSVHVKLPSQFGKAIIMNLLSRPDVEGIFLEQKSAILGRRNVELLISVLEPGFRILKSRHVTLHRIPYRRPRTIGRDHCVRDSL